MAVIHPRPAVPEPEPIDEELVAASIPDETSIVWVTPELATYWLTRNEKNRPVRSAHVNTMARDMATDHWIYTGEAIKFTKAGRLVDGQHRLHAIIKSRAVVKMLVVVDVPDESQQFMDAGAKRTAADALGLNGETIVTLLAATARLGILVDRMDFAGKSGVSTAEVIDWITYHPDVRRYVPAVSKYKKRIDARPSVMAYAMWRLHQVDSHAAHEFFMDIVELRSEGFGDPVYTLLARYQAARKGRERLTPKMELNFIFRAWNARRDRQQLKRLQAIPSESELVTPR